MPAPVTLDDLSHFTIVRIEERGDQTLLSGVVTKPEQMDLGDDIRFFISLNDDVPARVVELNRPARTAVLTVATEYLHPALTFGSSWPIYGDNWFGKINHILDTGLHWTHTTFVSPDSFERITPKGMRTWRAVEPGDENRTDGKIVPGGWDHEHCDICWHRIGISDDPQGYVNEADIWVCESCHARYIQSRDLRFMLEGAHDPDAPRTKEDDVFDMVSILIKNGEFKALNRFLDQGGDVNVRNRYGLTPLMTAASGGEEQMIGLLIDRHADVNAVATKHGCSALVLAAQKGHEKAVEMLLNARASVRVPEDFCRGSLMEYTLTGKGGNHPRILQMLKDAGAM